VLPDLHGHADHLGPLLLEQRRGNRRIDAAAHRDDHAFAFELHKTDLVKRTRNQNLGITQSRKGAKLKIEFGLSLRLCGFA